MAEITQLTEKDLEDIRKEQELQELIDYAGETSAPKNPDTETIETVKTLIRNGVDNKITKGYIQAYPKKFVDVTGDSLAGTSSITAGLLGFNDDTVGTDAYAQNLNRGVVPGNTEVGSQTEKQIYDQRMDAVKEAKTVEVNTQIKVNDTQTNGNTVTGAESCTDSRLDEMQFRLNNFFKRITGPGSAILNLPNEIKDISKILSTTMGGYVNKLMGSLGDHLSQAISKGFDKVATAILAKVAAGFTYPMAIAEIVAIQTGVMPAISKLFDGIKCHIPKIKISLEGVFSDLISAAVKNVVSVPACAVQQILGAATNKIKNMIDSVTSPLLGPIANVLGISNNIKSFLSAGIDVFKGVSSFLSCSPPQPKCAPTIKMGMGTKKSTSTNDKKLNFKKVFDGSNKNALSDAAKKGATEFEKTYGKWEIFGNKPLSEASELDPCYTGNLFKCGLPKVEIFGGGGHGAAGKVIFGAVVNKLDIDDIFKTAEKVGSIIGVEITNPGSGYLSEPIITFEDSCDKGYGAYAKAHVDFNQLSPTYGQVTSITMLSTGENYPAEEEPPLYIDKVIIEDPGEGYKDGDTLDDFKLEVLNGRIIQTKFSDARTYDDLPKLNIKSDTGVGAILKPIMSRKGPQGDIVQVIDCVS